MNESMLSAQYRERKNSFECEGIPELYRGAWMQTFSALLMLFLCMFVLRFGMLSLPEGRLTRALSFYPPRVLATPAARKRLRAPVDYWPTALAGRSEKIAAISEDLTRLSGSPMLQRVPGGDKEFGADLVLHAAAGFISLSLKSSAFPGGLDELSPGVREAIGIIGQTFSEAGFQIRIDAMSVLEESSRGLFNSDWELSTARAMAVLRQFLDAGVDAGSLSVGSYGGTKRGISGEFPNNGRAESRVDIIISLRK